MQQSLSTLNFPQFTKVSEFALKFVQAYISWKDPESNADIFTYFDNPRGNDELSLRTSLVYSLILPSFNYEKSQVEYESNKHVDLTLWSRDQKQKRKIAIIETKNSSFRNLTSTRQGRETPSEQLERYLTQAGIYLGVLTNGDEWHLFDFATSREPLASFSMIALARLLQDHPTVDVAEKRLLGEPELYRALTLTYYYLDAKRWDQTDIFRQNLADLSKHRVVSLQDSRNVELLVQLIKHVLGSLRETIRTQFELLRQRYAEYSNLCLQTNAQDIRDFEHLLQKEIDEITAFLLPMHLKSDEQIVEEARSLLLDLSREYLSTGDVAIFSWKYNQKMGELLNRQQVVQTSLTGQDVVHSISQPSFEKVIPLRILLQNHKDYINSLEEDYALSIKSINAYEMWRVQVKGIFHNPEDEFCLQTAYIHFVRLFFIRVCEDHELISRRISDGPFTDFEAYRLKLLSGIKDTYQRLLAEAYQRARSVYRNFFGHKELYDWFVLDEYTVLALFDLLNSYDFKGLSADVLGRVYNEGYIEAKERSEKGQFYTPPQVVDYMLDALGMPTLNDLQNKDAASFLTKTVGDLSCGSGTFLVAAALRKRTILQHRIEKGAIDNDQAISMLTETLLGMDVNPFACYLAEINLLVQCLPLLVDSSGEPVRSITRFHIYCTDALEPTLLEQFNAAFYKKVTKRLEFISPVSGKLLSTNEQSIASVKENKKVPYDVAELSSSPSGFDYLVGNPPYVSASEGSENLLYLNKVLTFGIYHLLHQRWDLFVPFFERNLQFLKPDTGRLGLIVSRGIETEGYAGPLRQKLIDQYRLLQIDFFPNLRLFRDAAVENTIVVLENSVPNEDHQVERRKHLQPDCKHYEILPSLKQLTTQEQIFRWRYDINFNTILTVGTLPLCSIVYIGTGVEAQSKESFDSVVNGKRQKLFTLEDVFISQTSKGNKSLSSEYVDEGVLGDDIDRYYLRRKRYVAFDRYKPKMRRPRNVALFRTGEKLLLGETSGGYYDTDGLFANHSVQVVVPWYSLHENKAIEDKGIKTVFKDSQRIAGIEDLVFISRKFDLRYLLAILNSNFIRMYIISNKLRGTRDGRIYPDVWKELPIKLASSEQQLQIAAKVDEIQELYKKIDRLPSINQILSDSSIHYQNIQMYLAIGILDFFGDGKSTISERLTIRGSDRLILRYQPGTYLESSSPELLEYLYLYLTQVRPDLQSWSWENARKVIQVPPSLETVNTLISSVKDRSNEETQLRTAIKASLAQIEAMIETIYKAPVDEDVLSIFKLKSVKVAAQWLKTDGI